MIWRDHNVQSAHNALQHCRRKRGQRGGDRVSNTQMYAQGQWESSSHKKLWHWGAQWGFCGMCREEDVQAKHYGLYRINSPIPSNPSSYTDLTPTNYSKQRQGSSRHKASYPKSCQSGASQDGVCGLFLYFLDWFYGEPVEFCRMNLSMVKCVYYTKAESIMEFKRWIFMNMQSVKLTYKKRFCRTQQDFLQAQIPIKGMLRVQ